MDPRGLVLFIPGFLGTAKDWNPIIAELRAKNVFWDFKTLDLFSPMSERISNFSVWALAINRSIAQMKNQYQDFSLIGYSLGGRLALHLMSCEESLWSKALICSAHPGLSEESEKQERLTSDQLWGERFLKEPWERVLKDWNSQAVLKGDNRLPPRLEHQFDRQRLAQAMSYWSLGEQQDFRPWLRNQERAIWWITGEQDQKFSSLARNIAHYKNIHWVNVKGAGHRVPWEQTNAFVKLSAEFLKEYRADIP